MDIEAIKQKVGERLGAKRFRHTEGVAGLAVELAGKLGEDPKAAAVAAWLHDVAKAMSIEEQLDYAARHGLPLSEDDYVSKGVIHARVGAHIASEEFGLRDKEVLFAIYHHPTGHGRMNRFHKILMAADYLEPNRTFEFRERLLDGVIKDFESGMLGVIRNRLEYILAKGDTIHPNSIDFYNLQLRIVNEGK